MLPLTKTSGRNMREKIGAGILLQELKRVDEINTRRVPKERERKREREMARVKMMLFTRVNPDGSTRMFAH